jgi:hypothetical protein
LEAAQYVRHFSPFSKVSSRVGIVPCRNRALGVAIDPSARERPSRRKRPRIVRRTASPATHTSSPLSKRCS